MNNKERDFFIAESAEYIKEKKNRDEYFEGRQLLEGQVQNKRDETYERLETVIRKADALMDSIEALYMDSVKGELDQFGSLSEKVIKARAHAINAQVLLQIAMLEGLPLPKTRKKKYHRTAAKLAVAFDDGPGVRQLARDIIDAAELEECSEPALTIWLREARSD